MICPKCGSANMKCTDSRPTNHRNAIKRRRMCLDCDHRWNTLEMPEKDIAEVVRCGNCKYFREFCIPGTKIVAGYGRCRLIKMDIDLTPDCYCSFGVGKEGEANE